MDYDFGRYYITNVRAFTETFPQNIWFYFDFLQFHAMVISSNAISKKGFSMESKQPAIANELKRRIKEEIYTDSLPDTATLADEFNVNIKTMAKAVNRLVREGLLIRRRHSGTRIRKGSVRISGDPLVEVLFEGFESIFTHPFWGEIWDGLVSRLSASGYRPILHLLRGNPETGMLDLTDFSLNPASGRILLGISDRSVFDAAEKTGAPFISACDPVNLPVPQVFFDFSYGIQKAVDHLADRGCVKIAFIGPVVPRNPVHIAHKYLAYKNAMENSGLAESIEFEHALLTPSGAADALKKLLNRTIPDAIIAAHDHQLPQVLELLRSKSLKIPVIGCDGLKMEGIPAKRRTVKIPLHECGEAIARQLITAINRNRKPVSFVLPSSFA